MKRLSLLLTPLLLSAPLRGAEPEYASPLDFILGSSQTTTQAPATPAATVSPALQSAVQSITQTGNPLDIISGASALDLVASAQRSPLDVVVSSQSSPLDFITAAYSSKTYYQTGSWGGQYSWGGISTTFPPLPDAECVLPATGRITSGFGYRPSFGRQHKGVDIAMAVGDTVRVALSGVITRVSCEPKGYGNYVVVSHDNGYETRYAHLSLPLVSIGEAVEAGQPIALSGNTGNSTGPHLHFETRYNGHPLDPTRFFAFNDTQRLQQSLSTLRAGEMRAEGTDLRSGENTNPLGDRHTYVIRAGDNLTKISRKTGLSISRLCQLNMLDPKATLQIGRMLRLR